jgi:hypothetical protein
MVLATSFQKVTASAARAAVAPPADINAVNARTRADPGARPGVSTRGHAASGSSEVESKTAHLRGEIRRYDQGAIGRASSIGRDGGCRWSDNHGDDEPTLWP